MNTIVLASGNAGKLREFDSLLNRAGYTVRPQSDFAVPECPEPHPTFVENAIAKARHAARYSGLPALADDSGICAEALGGQPGIRSARYAEAPDGTRSDAANNAKLSAALADSDNLSVYYVCVLALLRHEHDPCPLIAQGIWHGQWCFEASGSGGFGYDPHFFLPEYGLSAAMLPAATKNRISHRAQALNRLLSALNRQNGDTQAT